MAPAWDKAVQEPLFLIAPPRSYTSVVGGMLGQHPQAYGLPEVNLSHGDTLGDMWDSIPGSANFGTAGLLRLLAELHDGEQTEEAVVRARQWILRRQHWSGAKVFYHIRDTIGPDRMIVEKSPRNTIFLDNLQRLHRIFPRANFLHLTRHPRTQGKSVMDLIQDTTGSAASNDPEKIWLRCQSNIVEFSRELPVGQYMRIKGETLLRDPRFYLRQICDWLGLDSDEASIDAMLHPEQSPFACMGPPSAPAGNDPNFLTNPKLDFDRLARIREPSLEGEIEWKPGQVFTKPVLRLSRQFGYT